VLSAKLIPMLFNPKSRQLMTMDTTAILCVWKLDCWCQM